LNEGDIYEMQPNSDGSLHFGRITVINAVDGGNFHIYTTEQSIV